MGRLIRSDFVRWLLAASALVSALVLAGPVDAQTYTYDMLGRLTSVTADNGVITYYCYDATGNRTYVGPNACA